MDADRSTPRTSASATASASSTRGYGRADRGRRHALAARSLGAPATHEPTRRREIWALRDVSFEVDEGEVVGIIGRNGAGKSTLLKILSRITEPTDGRAVIDGRVGSLLEVGTGFHPELTGRENIYPERRDPRHAAGARSSAKFDEIVAFAEVERFLDTPVKRYSSGMYVRLAFAVAAHLEPEILLVDEVLAVGDAAFQKKCLGQMGEVARSGRTVLFVSHNLARCRRCAPARSCSSAAALPRTATWTRFSSTTSLRCRYRPAKPWATDRIERERARSGSRRSRSQDRGAGLCERASRARSRSTTPGRPRRRP